VCIDHVAWDSLGNGHVGTPMAMARFLV